MDVDFPTDEAGPSHVSYFVRAAPHASLAVIHSPSYLALRTCLLMLMVLDNTGQMNTYPPTYLYLCQGRILVTFANACSLVLR